MTTPGMPGGADGAKGSGDHDGNDHGPGQLNVVQLRHEHGGHALHDGAAIHVQRGAQRQGEGCHLLRNADAAAELDGIRQGGVGGGGGEGHQRDTAVLFEEAAIAQTGEDLQHQAVDDQAEQEEQEDLGGAVLGQRHNDREAQIGNGLSHQSAHAIGSQLHDDIDDLQHGICQRLVESLHRRRIFRR